MPIPRFLLLLIAKSLRACGDFLNRYLYDRIFHIPLYHPTIIKSIPSTLSPFALPLIHLNFYYPSSYSSSSSALFPCILNFHGGGFTIGTSLEDNLWLRYCVEDLNCIVCSVDYRLAPEYAYPIPIQDGVDALLYLRKHSEELGIDPEKITTSGFSAGGNLAVTVPIMARDVLDERAKKEGKEGDEWGIKAVMAWYPVLDRTVTKEEKVASMANPNKALPTILATFFDESYIPRNIDRTKSYLSPTVAKDEVLKRGLPDKIVIRTCENDMLCEEARAFAERLGKLGKDVRYGMVEGVSHGWDKFPGALPKPEGVYEEACGFLREVFKD